MAVDTVCLVSADVVHLKDADTVYLTCPTTQVGSGPAISGRRGPYTDHNARKNRLILEDEELLVLV